MLFILRRDVCHVGKKLAYSGFDWLQYILAIEKPDKKFFSNDGVTFFDLVRAGKSILSYFKHYFDENKYLETVEPQELISHVVLVSFAKRDNLTIPTFYQFFGIERFTFRQMPCISVSDGVFCCKKDYNYYIVDNKHLTFSDPIDDSCELDIVKAVKGVFKPPKKPVTEIKTSLQVLEMLGKRFENKQEELLQELNADTLGEYLKVRILEKILYEDSIRFSNTQLAEFPKTIDELFWLVVDVKYDYLSQKLSGGIEYCGKRYYLQDRQETLLDFLRADKIFVADTDSKSAPQQLITIKL